MRPAFGGRDAACGRSAAIMACRARWNVGVAASHGGSRFRSAMCCAARQRCTIGAKPVVWPYVRTHWAREGSGPGGVREIVQTDAERSRLEHTDRRQTLTSDNLFDLLIYYGRVPGEILLKNDVQVDDPQGQYECEIWVCGGYVIKASLNPHPLGTRPYYTCSFEPVPGQIWGRGLPMLLRDVQRVANGATHSLVRNMAPVLDVGTWVCSRCRRGRRRARSWRGCRLGGVGCAAGIGHRAHLARAGHVAREQRQPEQRQPARGRDMGWWVRPARSALDGQTAGAAGPAISRRLRHSLGNQHALRFPAMSG